MKLLLFIVYVFVITCKQWFDLVVFAHGKLSCMDVSMYMLSILVEKLDPISVSNGAQPAEHYER